MYKSFCCWLGAGVIVMPGITIGDNSVIGAGSVVTHDIPANVVAFGNPCRVNCVGRDKMIALGNIALAWLGIINGVAFVMYGVDKYKSIHHKWRIPESTLLLLTLTGGSVGAMIGMQVFHHKTKHLKFKYGVPLAFLAQIIVCLCVFR